MKNKRLKRLGSTLAIGTMLFTSFGTSIFADETDTYAMLIQKAFSGKNNTISGSTVIKNTSSHSFRTTGSQGKFSCRLTERYSGSSPDKVIKSNTSDAASRHRLSPGTYYIRYEGNSDNAKTIGSLE